MIARIILILLMSLAQVAGAADEIVLKEQHPTAYRVVTGDTLWDIASRFLRDPWRWPDIWYVNPQIENPHLIYPGDEVVLTYRDGKPQLELRRGSKGLRTIRLGPEVRREAIEKAIPTIPLDAIRQFISRPRVVSEEQLEAAPYVVSSSDEHLIAASGDTIYVRGLEASEQSRYSLFRPGEEYRDPDTDDVLGHEAIYVGEAVVTRFGNPASLTIARSTRETLVGDRLLPAGLDALNTEFMPRAPEKDVSGKIIAVVDGVSRIGQHHIVVLNRGTREGVQRGHVLAVFQSGKEVRDVVDGDRVTLPDEQAGYLMVFRAFESLSFALVMSAERDIKLFDMIRNP